MKKETKKIIAILFIALILRIILSFFGTLRLDQGTFVAWSISLAENGFKSFYSGWSDYLPGYLYILWFLGKIRGLLPEVVLYKLPAILADVATGFLIYKLLKGKKGLLGAVVYLFNPAIWANSALWGQVDSLTVVFSLLSIYLLVNYYWLSAIFLTVGTLIKPQAAFILPVILFLMIKNKFSFFKVLGFGVLALGVFLLGFLPFSDGNLFQFVISRIELSVNQYPYTAVNAFNFWGLFGQWKPDNVYFQFGGYLAFLVSFLIFARKQKSEYLLATFAFLFTFLFFTRMHERHLLPVFAPLTILAAGEFLYLVPLVGLSLVYLLNLFYSYNWITYNFKVSFNPFSVIILGLLSFAAFLFISLRTEKTKIWIRSLLNLFNRGRKYVPDKFPKSDIKYPRFYIFLFVILLFSFATRTYKLGEPPNEYFDEVYHAFTARLILHNDPKAWEWWNPHPEGFAYEWTHPPLAKLGMVLGMKVFGENSFGWRIPEALLGVGSVFWVFLLAAGIFKDKLAGVLSAVVFALDGLPLVMSRIGMNDSYLLFFALGAIYFFLKKQDYLSAFSFGFALASKWSAVWVIPILFVLWLKRREKFSLGLLWFLFLPPLIYLASYAPMFWTGHDLNIFWGMQKQMWWYHTSLRASHPYTSPWWNWPLLVRPIYLYTSDEIGGFVSRIYAMGNPAVFWFGLISVILCFIYSYQEKNKNLAFIIFAYLIFFVPWAASPRIMFLYHYLPSIPFLAITAGYVLRRNLRLIFPFLIISFLLFVYFFPHWAGLKVPVWLDNSYYWFSSWR